MTAFDPLSMLRRLQEHDVRYILIGGIAAVTHGSPSVTQDLDVCYDRSPGNLERLARMLQHVHARLRGAPADVPWRPDAATLAAGDHFTLITDAGDFDLLGTPAGTDGYADLNADAVSIDLDDGLVVMVTSLEDLIRMKLAAGRAKDRAEAEILGALRDVRDGIDDSV